MSASSLDGPGTAISPSSDLGARVTALEEAAVSARGRVDDALVGRLEQTAARATDRIRLSASHTVVAIAGATGSGKSSTFNALTGLDLSSVGVRRPTTSWATACIWGSGDDAVDLMEWLGIPPRHQTTRDSMLDGDAGDDALEGVVLLDLPDHDSTEVSHHQEVDRLVVKTDLLVWVLDPQKYADAAIHDRYLKPYAAQQDIMLVVLNQIDSVPEERREAMLGDVRRLLDDDGLPRVPVHAVSAREGWGIDELRAEIVRRVDAKRAMVARLDADIVEAAELLAVETGETRTPELGPARERELTEAVAVAAGVPPLVDAVGGLVQERAARATAWPPLRLLGRDPLRRLESDQGEAAAVLRRAHGEGPQTVTVPRARIEAAARSLGDALGDGLAPRWAGAVQRAAVGGVEATGATLDRSLASADLRTRWLPGWVQALRVVQWLLLLAVAAGLVVGVLQASGAADLGGPVWWGWALAGGALLLALLLSVVGRAGARGAGRRAAADLDAELRASVTEAVEEHVLAPLRAEVEAYGTVRARVAAARVRRH